MPRDELVALPTGTALHRVTFENPETGEIFLFITNPPPSVPPGLVALLYKLRQDIEKLLDEVNETSSKSRNPGPRRPAPNPFRPI